MNHMTKEGPAVNLEAGALKSRKVREDLGKCVKCMNVRRIVGWGGGKLAGNGEENESHATTADSGDFLNNFLS